MAIPEQAGYSVGSVVELEALVFDDAGQPILPPPEVIWALPAEGISSASPAQGEVAFCFDAEGQLEISAHLAPPHADIGDQRWIWCDNEPPILSITTPARGGTLTGDDADSPIIVTGNITDAVSGVATVALNGTSLSLSDDGRFEESVPPLWGLNPVEVVATDHVGWAGTAKSSSYYSTHYLTSALDGTGPGLTASLAAYLGQAIFDDGDRDCSFGGETGYACQSTPNGDAYDDMATLVQVILNNLDLATLEGEQVYDSGWQDLAGGIITNITLPTIPNPFGNNWSVQGNVVFAGSYRVMSRISSVEIAQAVMGDDTRGILGLTVREAGLDLLAYVPAPTATGNGLTIPQDLDVELHLDLFFDICLNDPLCREQYPDNGIWEVNGSGTRVADVTSGACDDFGAIYWIDITLGSDFNSWICASQPVGAIEPARSTSASTAFARACFSGDVQASTSSENGVDVTIVAHQDGDLVELGGSTVEVAEMGSLVIDLSEVVLFNGLFPSLNLGSYDTDLDQNLLADLVANVPSLLVEMLEPRMEALIVCGGQVASCPLTVESYLETVFNSVTAHEEAVSIPSPFPGADPVVVTVNTTVHSVTVGPDGAVLELDSFVTSDKSIPESVPIPRGVLLRNNAENRFAVEALARDGELALASDLDLFNQMLFATWWAGGLNGNVNMSTSSLPDGVEELTLVFEPLLPPILLPSTEESSLVILQWGALRVDASCVIDDQEAHFDLFVDLGLTLAPQISDGNLVLRWDGNEPDIYETEIVAGEPFCELRSDVAQAILTQVEQAVLASVSEVSRQLPVPTVNLGDATIPGPLADLPLSLLVGETWQNVPSALTGT